MAAGGSGVGDAGGPHWGRLRPPAPAGKGKEVVGGWRATDAGDILEGSEQSDRLDEKKKITNTNMRNAPFQVIGNLRRVLHSLFPFFSSSLHFGTKVRRVLAFKLPISYLWSSKMAENERMRVEFFLRTSRTWW